MVQSWWMWTDFRLWTVAAAAATFLKCHSTVWVQLRLLRRFYCESYVTLDISLLYMISMSSLINEKVTFWRLKEYRQKYFLFLSESIPKFELVCSTFKITSFKIKYSRRVSWDVNLKPQLCHFRSFSSL